MADERRIPLVGTTAPRTMSMPDSRPAVHAESLRQLVATRRLGNADALLAPGLKSCSYGQLGEQIDYMGHALRDCGVQRSDRVAVVLPNGPNMAAAFLGIAAYATCAPLNPSYRKEEIEFTLRDLDAKAVVVPAGANLPARDVANRLGLTLMDLQPSTSQLAGVFTFRGVPAEFEPQNEWGKGDDVALVLHTSGTTSRPKQVPLSHRNLCFSACNIASVLGLLPDDRCLNVMPLFHIHGLVGVLLSSMFAGGSVVCSTGYDNGNFAKLLRDFRPTWYSAVPTIHQSVAALAKENPAVATGGHLRLIRSSSSALPPTVMAELEETFHVPVIESYGMTEAAHQMASNPLPPAARKSGSVGLPAGPEMAIMDDEGNLLPAGETGEIVVRGSNVTAGYANNREANEAAFTDGWFRTGDLGCTDHDGYFSITGRKKELINRGGENISPREIDEVLLEHPAVAQAAAFAVPHSSLGEDVVAAVVLQDRVDVSEQELREFTFTRLADFKVPSQIVFVAAIPQGPTGKLQRIGLHEQLGDQLRPEFVAPSTPLEKELAEVWAEVLSIPRIGLNDNFFRLGGDSIRAAQVLNRIQARSGVELSFRDLFEQPTLAGTVDAVGQLQRGQAQYDKGVTPSPQITPDPARRFEPFPLNEIQQAYWMGRGGDFQLGRVSTHRYVEIDSVDLDLERLSRAWQRLVHRHDMLRVIVLPDGRQQILEQVPAYEIDVLDVRGKEKQEVECRLDAVRRRMSHQVLPSDKWPIFEIRATRLDDRRVRIHGSFDGLIFDAWSRFLLLREWHHLYEQPDSELPTLELSFRDYVLAESRLEDTEEFRRAQQYWWNRLPTLPPAPNLPLSRKPDSVTKPRFERWSARLDPTTWQRIKARATEAGVRPTGSLISAFAEVLGIWSEHSHFTINLTLFNRLPLHPQVNDIVGDFTSLGLLEVDNRSQAAFKDRAQQLQNQLSQDLQHRQVSSIKVARELGRRQRQERNQLMPVVFTRYRTHDERSGDLDTMRWIGDVGFVASQTPQVWIDLQVGEESGGLGLHWNAVKQIFPDGMIEDMFEAYCELLRRLAADEDSWTKNADALARSLIPQTQLAQRDRVNATRAPVSDELLHTLFAAEAANQPNHPAVISPNRTLSYEETDYRARSIGHQLQNLGARPNTLVGVVMEKGWEQIVAVLGVHYSGAAYLPIDPELPQRRVTHLLQHGEVDVVLTQSWVDSQVDWPAGTKRLCIDQQELTEYDSSTCPPLQQPSDLAYVIYTSGSTGAPKGVMIDHRGAVNTILDVNQRFEVGPSDRVLALASLGFDLSVYDIFGTLAAGGTIVIPESSGTKDPAHWAELISRCEVTIWNSVPALMELLTEYVADRSDSRLDSLRLILLSGDWIPLTLPEKIRKLAAGAVTIGLGGATEASIWSNLFPIDIVDPQWASIPYGKPMTNQCFQVLDEQLAPRPVWVPGHLHIGGVGLAMGYWRDEKATRSAFITHPTTGQRWYRTGDLGRYLPDGNLEFLGRIDSQVKIQGFRVELNEIEAALSQHPAIQAAVVTASGPAQGEKRLVGYLVPSSNVAPPESELRQFLIERLPEYMVPRRFVTLSELPLSANGKVNRKALPAASMSADHAHLKRRSSAKTGLPEAYAEADSKGSQIAKRIAAVAADVLEVKQIDLDADFIKLGATSLDMIRIANRVDQELGWHPNMDEFFQDPTVLDLARNFQRREERVDISTPDARVVEASAPAASIVDRFELVVDPLEREAFKKERPGMRRRDDDQLTIPLDNGEPDETVREKYVLRRSHRRFSQDPVPFTQLSELLNCLGSITLNGEPKYLYGSAGGLYPVQTYLYVKPGRIESLEPGTYYYDPSKHQLVLVSADAKIDRRAYDLLINRPVFDEAAFGVFLVAQLSAIAPMYREQSLPYATIEAGAICQLLESSASRFGIGLCQIGTVNLPNICHLFALDESHVLVHSLLGGGIHTQQPADSLSQKSCETSGPELTEREEGEI